MLTLALDTSSSDGSVSLFENHTLLGTKHWNRHNSHCEILPEQVFELLNNSKKNMHEVKCVAVGTGPGSFTGIRVAINFVKTLAYTNQIDVLTCNSLKLMALQVQKSTQPICCIQFGFRNLLYKAAYKLDNGRVVEIDAPSALTIEDFLSSVKTPHLILGTGYEYCLPLIKAEQSTLFVRDSKLLDYPLSQSFLKFFSDKHESKNFVPWTKVEPLYIRASEAEEKLKTIKSKNL